ITLMFVLAGVAQAQSIIVFTGPDFRGQQQTFDRALQRLADLGWDDRIASVQVRGDEWQLCRQESFTECITVSRDVPNLASWGMDYAVNSLRPVRGDQPPSTSGTPSITVFEGSGFRGQQRGFQASIPKLRNQGWSDRIGSIVVGGGEWDLCANEEFRDCVTISEDQPDLTSQRLEYRVRSLRPVVPVEVEPPPPTGLPTPMTQAQSEYVAEHLYRAALGREPDPEGLNNAISEIRFGNLEKLTNSLVFSSEGRALRLSPEERLEQIYQGLLGRPPQAGAQSHLPRLQQGRPDEVILTILNSEEFLRDLPQN
ncbi:MAG: beta/gamma crystallin-related protein, partial [Thermoanaerobaculia bacterium]